MKKLLAIVLSVLLLLSVTACGKDTAKPLAAEAGDVYTTYGPVYIDDLQPTVEDGNIRLTLRIRNDSEYLVTYGESFTVERQDGDTWIKLEIPENYGFFEVAYLLEAGKTGEITYDATFYYGVAQPGTYRLKTDCYVEDTSRGATPTRCQLWADFTVTQ